MTADGAPAPLVLVDARFGRRRPTGLASYIDGLRGALADGAAEGLRIEWIDGLPALPRRGWATRLGNLLLDVLWLHVCVPWRAWRAGAALVHAPVNWGPWWCPCPVVVTVQDLAWERVPEAFPPTFRRYARALARRTLARTRRVVVTSRSTARDVQDLYGTRPERIVVVPIGVEPDAEPPRPREPFVLCAGVLEPRKRVPALVEGHARYLTTAPADPPPCRLVVVGAGGADEERVRAAAGPMVTLAGFVPRAELLELYRRATLLVYPSAYEGFGIPVLEAMARGCPVLVARNSALPEVGGDSALYLDDVSPDGIAAALASALADRAALARRGEAGRLRAAAYGWPEVGARTAAVYREALGLGAPDA